MYFEILNQPYYASLQTRKKDLFDVEHFSGVIRSVTSKVERWKVPPT